MQLPLAGAEAEPEPTNTPAAIKAAADAENRACRMTPPLKWDRSLRFANRLVKPSLATLFKSREAERPPSVADRLLPRVTVAFWRKYDINTRVASHTFAHRLFSMTELVGAADHHHEPVAVHRLRRCPGRGEFGECRQSES